MYYFHQYFIFMHHQFLCGIYYTAVVVSIIINSSIVVINHSLQTSSFPTFISNVLLQNSNFQKKTHTHLKYTLVSRVYSTYTHTKKVSYTTYKKK